MITNSRSLGVWVVCLALALMAVSPGAAAQIMNMSRTVAGLDANGWFLPGTTSLTFTVTLDRGLDTDAIIELIVEETLPAGWTFDGAAPSGSAPTDYPGSGATGTGTFQWYVMPAFPCSFSYKVNIPADVTDPVTLTGITRFRILGTEGTQYTSQPPTETLIQQEPVSISAAQSWAGTVGPGGNFYKSNGTLVATVTLTQGGPDATFKAVGFKETIPTGWTLVPGSVGGSNPPQTTSGNTGTLSFAWFTIPTFPVSFTFSVRPETSRLGTACFRDGQCLYRLDEGELFSNIIPEKCLEEFPCLAMEREAPAYYGMGQNLTLRVTFNSDCGSNPVTALRLEETLPIGWTFVSAAISPTIDENKLTFTWAAPPAFPHTFDYTVNVPVTSEGGAKEIIGKAVFTSGGTETSTPEIRSTLVRQNTPPEITLLGEASVAVECGSAYNDAGATALDDLDGDISALIVVNNPVNIQAPGTYTVTYNITDSEGGAAAQKTRTVIVQDTQAPSLTLLGAVMINVECGTAFTDPGVLAEDTCDGDLLARVAVTGQVLVNTPGMYTLAYNVSDNAGHAAPEVVRTVNVLDRTAPVISLLGANPLTIECGSGFSDPGAVAQDGCAGDLSAIIQTQSTVRPSQPGQYTVSYTVKDPAANEATPVVRVVNVVDTTPPTVTLNGPAALTHCRNTPYTDQGAVATDACDSSLTVTPSGQVIHTSLGTYVLTYSSTDDSGNTGTATRRVTVVDCTPPLITLLGQNPYYIECGSTYQDAGATARDDIDGPITPSPSSNVNTQVAGTYAVTYNARDAAGNNATPVARQVIVTDTAKPVITLLGSPELTVQCGSNYTDAGARADDTCNGNITGSIVVNNPVNTRVAGVYQVTYNVSDTSGNAADTVRRTVTVSDTSAPIITLNGSPVVSLLCGETYTELGATATDTCDGNLSGRIVVGGDVVDPKVSGAYLITYNVKDAVGNAAPTVTRSVYVEDFTPPVLTLRGASQIIIDCGTEYIDDGATASDGCDGDITDRITVAGNAVDTTKPGHFTLTYNVSDHAGNPAEEVVRNVFVEGPLCEEIEGAVEGEGGEEGEGEGSAEGGPEGEPEGQALECLLQSVAITSPTGDVVIQAGVNALVSFTSEVTFTNPACIGAPTVVTYAIDGVVVAVSENQEQGFPGTAQLLPGRYTLEVVARVPDTGSAVAAVRAFSVRTGLDLDNNGLLDNPFRDLPSNGDLWTAVVPGGACQRAVSMVAWRRGPGNVVLAVPRPDAPGQVVTITAPKSLVAENEEGILIAAIACDFNSLLGTAQAALLAKLPDLMVPGGVPFEISALVTNNHGASFAELDNALVEAMPIHVALNGLGFRPEFDASFFSHPTAVNSHPRNGLYVEVQRGNWSNAAMDNIETRGGTLLSDVTALSTFAPLEQPIMGPTLKTIPDARHPFIIGIVEVGGIASNTLTVKNIGRGVVEGAAALEDPNGVFSLVNTVNYRLSHNAAAEIEVVFSPDAVGDYIAMLTLSNGEDTTMQVQLRGTGTSFGKFMSWFGCAPGAAPGGWLGDLVLMAGALALLSAAGWRVRRHRAN